MYTTGDQLDMGVNQLRGRQKQASLDRVLFGLSLTIFLATRLIGLESFPIYFFTDEAANTVLAADFVHNSFRDSSGQFFPTYFENDGRFNLSVSVYAQIIPYTLFGFSVFATRATSVLIACLGTMSVGLILREFFKVRFWWAGVLLLSITPAWFLHSRTAFETVMMVSFYAIFLYFYLQYRYHRPERLYPALLFGAMAFYAYNGAQLVVVLTGLLLLLSDFRYHLRNWRVTSQGLLLAGLLALPYLRFQIQHPDEMARHLQLLDSYWTHDLGLGEKLSRFWQEYAYGLSPGYWYVADNTRDLLRHQMKGYGNILLVTAPFIVIGAIVCLSKIRSPAHRAVLIAALAVPAGGALVAIHITRVLAFVVPVAILSAIGLSAVLERLTRRVAYAWLAVGLFTVLGTVNMGMLYDALVNGPTWSPNYGLGGLQYGARQVFEAVRDYREQSPQTPVWIFPTWLNGSEMLRRFFLDDDPQTSLLDLDTFLLDKVGGIDQALFIVTREDYQRLLDSRKFFNVRVERTLDLPDRTTGFYFVRLNYSPEADAVFTAEREAQNLTQVEITLGGQAVTIRHSPLEAGEIRSLFDNDPQTGVRLQGNPAVVEIIFPEPRRWRGITMTTGRMAFYLMVRLLTVEEGLPARYLYPYRHASPGSSLDLAFDPMPDPAQRVRIEIINIDGNDLIQIDEVALY